MPATLTDMTAIAVVTQHVVQYSSLNPSNFQPVVIRVNILSKSVKLGGGILR